MGKRFLQRTDQLGPTTSCRFTNPGIGACPRLSIVKADDPVRNILTLYLTELKKFSDAGESKTVEVAVNKDGQPLQG